MDNESRATPLACCVTDFNVLPLGALIFLAAINPWHNAEFSIEALHRSNRYRVVTPDIGGRSFYRFLYRDNHWGRRDRAPALLLDCASSVSCFSILAFEYGFSLGRKAAMCALSPIARDLQPAS